MILRISKFPPLLAVLALGCSGNDASDSTQIEQRLSGSEVVEITQTDNEPVVQIWFKGAKGQGSGVLLAPDIVLTAAHVVQDFRNAPGRIEVVHGVGTANKSETVGKQVAIHWTHVAGLKTEGALERRDIALIQLEQPIASFSGTFDTNIVAFEESGLTVTAGPCTVDGVKLPQKRLCSAEGTIVASPIDLDGDAFDLKLKQRWFNPSAHIVKGDSGAPVYRENCAVGGICEFGPGILGLVTGNIKTATQTRTGSHGTIHSVDLVDPLFETIGWISRVREVWGSPQLTDCFAPYQTSNAPHVVCASKKNKTASLDLQLGFGG